MKDHLATQKFIQLILRLADDVMATKEQLTELDASIGDGDLGVTMSVGFNAVKEDLGGTHPSNPQEVLEVLRIAGKAFADKAASTFGTLMAAMFMRAGEAAKGKECIGAVEFLP
ncbi:MAG: DAK2 domain-containing protein [Thermodesulfobacteriota bacterium]